jgi:Flp pilus assembly protein TadG
MEQKAKRMNSRFEVTSARKRKSRGHVMLESVFTLLPMFALLFGIIDLSVMTFRWSTLQNAVREGVRYAITFQTSGGLGQTASIQSVVEQNSFGFVKASDSPQHIFVSYLNPDLTTGSNTPGNVVEVTVKNISFSFMAPLSGSLAGPLYATSPLTFKVVAADILGGYPVGVSSVSQ